MSRSASALARLRERFRETASGFRIYADAHCATHDPGPHLPDSPDRLAAIFEGFAALPTTTPIAFRECLPAGWRELRAVHDDGYLLALESALHSGRPYFMHTDCPLDFGSDDAILASAGLGLALGDGLADGVSGFALTRPPGHHAGPARAEGFCYLNNTALAVARYRARHPGARIAVIDLDLHHGNGTQACLENRPETFFLSLHGDPEALLYPYGGFLSENRDTPGIVRNHPMPEGTSGKRWLAELSCGLDEVVRFDPEVVLIGLGLDGHREDPFGFFLLEDDDFIEALRRIRAALPSVPLGLLLEGGYAPDVVRRLVPSLAAEAAIFFANKKDAR